MGVVRINLPNGRIFEWTGTSEQGLGIIRTTESAAEIGGVTFKAFTYSCLRNAQQETTLTADEQAHLVAGVLAFVLGSNTDSPKYPGRFVDHLGSTGFEFDIIAGDEGFDIDARVRGRLHS